MVAKTKKKQPLFAIITLTVLIIYMISLVIPLIWGIYTSLLSNVEYGMIPNPSLTFETYMTAFDVFSVPISELDGSTREVFYEEMMLNSVIYSLGCALCQTSVLCITAYSTSRFNFKFDKVIYTIVIITMILPIVGSLPSEIAVADFFNLRNKIWGMFIMKSHFLGMYYLVFNAMFRSVPKDFDEAAYIDGAGNFTIFFKIIFPITVGTFVTIALINFISFWNDYTTPLIYMPNIPTVAYGLYGFVQESTTADKVGTPIKLAACMLVFIPNFIIFLVFRNKLIGNISMGGLKE
ncbi:MAG: carbohydrate ABC transporter permease [Clostridia bacterium]|nr:carbohydrate ABC transporter permease [Clostridia bacterium]